MRDSGLCSNIVTANEGAFSLLPTRSVGGQKCRATDLVGRRRKRNWVAFSVCNSACQTTSKSGTVPTKAGGIFFGGRAKKLAKKEINVSGRL